MREQDNIEWYKHCLLLSAVQVATIAVRFTTLADYISAIQRDAEAEYNLSRNFNQFKKEEYWLLPQRVLHIFMWDTYKISRDYSTIEKTKEILVINQMREALCIYLNKTTLAKGGLLKLFKQKDPKDEKLYGALIIALNDTKLNNTQKCEAFAKTLREHCRLHENSNDDLTLLEKILDKLRLFPELEEEGRDARNVIERRW